MVALWMAKADSDLRTASVLMELQSEHFEAITFHCQQAVEKVLKGYLVHHNIRFNKTHNIGLLLDTIATLDSPFSTDLRHLENLSKYAVAYRYPEETDMPYLDRKSVEKILEITKNAVKIILLKI
jgi:HEPN domain-containing protein